VSPTLPPETNEFHRLKALVLDSVSSPITRRVYNLGLDEFIAWYGLEVRPGFTKAAVSAWRVTLESRRLGNVSINVRITAVRKLTLEAADNGCWRAGTGRRDQLCIAANPSRLCSFFGVSGIIPALPTNCEYPIPLGARWSAPRPTYKNDWGRQWGAT